MQTFQMAILLLFEKTNDLSGRDIQESVQIPEDQLIKQIQSLVDAKLLKDPGSEVNYNLILLLKFNNIASKLTF